MAILTERVTWQRAPFAGRRAKVALSPAEQAHARIALRELRRHEGSPLALAKVLRVAKTTVDCQCGSTPVTLPMVVRIARVAGVPIGDVLTGVWPFRVCPACGRSG